MKMLFGLRRITELAVAFSAATSASADFRFHGIGVDSGTAKVSSLTDVSADGMLAVGSYRIGDISYACRWTEADGVELMGYNSNNWYAVNATGDVIAGTVWSDPGRWRPTDDWVYLGYFPDGPPYTGGSARAISADGSILAGEKRNEAFRWTESDGMQRLGELEPGWDGCAWDMSADGSIIIGDAWYGSTHRGFTWAENEGMVALPSLIPDTATAAYAVSADGSVIVGWGTTGLGEVAVRWFEDDAYILGYLDRDNYGSEALDVSGDGSVAVGYSDTAEGEQAFIWTEDEGIHNLKHYLMLEYDFQIDDWMLTKATGISDDGTVIVGEGINPEGYTEGWYLRLTPPIPGDINYDGEVDQVDLGILLANWTAR